MDTARYLVAQGSHIDLSRLPTIDHEYHGLGKTATRARTEVLVERLSALQEMLFAQQERRVLVVIQAMDTGGKDGLIKGVCGPLNPQGVRVVPFKAPTPEELAHDFLWRVHTEVPRDGELVVFNRSHYEDVLIVRVHGLVPPKTWRARFEHIRRFESLLHDEGTTIVKFFLHISPEEQKARLQARLDDPTKHWKFNVADLSERKRWDDYRHAYEDALAETSAVHAPWYVIPSDKKWFRDLVAAQVLVDTLESLDLAFPESEDLRGVVIE